eukprot:1884777-Rhodomonas_salina.1
MSTAPGPGCSRPRCRGIRGARGRGKSGRALRRGWEGQGRRSGSERRCEKHRDVVAASVRRPASSGIPGMLSGQGKDRQARGGISHAKQDCSSAQVQQTSRTSETKHRQQFSPERGQPLLMVT